MRTMIAPGRWRDDGPSTATAYAKPYSAVHADNVGSMRPTLTAGGNAFEWRGVKTKAYSIHVENRHCGVPLHGRGRDAGVLTGELCARTAGHTSSDHSSATTMAREAARRRGR